MAIAAAALFLAATVGVLAWVFGRKSALTRPLVALTLAVALVGGVLLGRGLGVNATALLAGVYLPVTVVTLALGLLFTRRVLLQDALSGMRGAKLTRTNQRLYRFIVVFTAAIDGVMLGFLAAIVARWLVNSAAAVLLTAPEQTALAARIGGGPGVMALVGVVAGLAIAADLGRAGERDG